jgi:hypothetical protein
MYDAEPLEFLNKPAARSKIPQVLVDLIFGIGILYISCLNLVHSFITLTSQLEAKMFKYALSVVLCEKA